MELFKNNNLMDRTEIMEMSSKYSCIHASGYEMAKSREDLPRFLPNDIHEAKTVKEKESIYNDLKEKGKLNFMAVPDFYQFIVKDKKRAILEYEKVISKHGTEGLPLAIFQAPFTVEIFSRIQIAICYQDLGDYKNAIEYYKYGYPWYPYHFEIAECYKKMGDAGNAREYYLKAIDFHRSKKWASTPLLAFRAYLEMGDKNGALKFLKEARKDYDEAEFEKMLKIIIECLESQEPNFIKEMRNKIKNSK